MTLRELREFINQEFVLYINGIKLVDNFNADIPNSILNMEVEKWDKTNGIITVYLK